MESRVAKEFCRPGYNRYYRGNQRRRSSMSGHCDKQDCQGIRANRALGSRHTDSETPGLARGQSNGATEWVTESSRLPKSLSTGPWRVDRTIFLISPLRRTL